MLSNCIFDSLAELSAYFGTVITLPENTPDDCNVICFHVSFKGGIKLFQVCKEDKQGFFNLVCNDKWEKSSDSLEDEVRFDKCLITDKFEFAFTAYAISDFLALKAPFNSSYCFVIWSKSYT